MAKNSKDLEVRGIDIIPGIGIIRVRCLRKAGYESVDSLASVTLEEIAAVPGIGEAKARQIKDFIDQLGAPVARRSVRQPANGADSAAGSRRPTVSPAAEAASAVDRVKKLARMASDLLRAPIANQFEPKLAKQVGRVAALTLDTEPGRKQVERVLAQTAKLEALLTEIAESDQLSEKRQEKLSDELRDRRKKLNQTL